MNIHAHSKAARGFTQLYLLGLSVLFEPCAQCGEGALFDAGHIRTGNVQAIGDLALCFRRISAKPVTANDNLAFALVADLANIAAKLLSLDLAVEVIGDEG